MNYYAGIDLGGTKTYCVIIDEKGNILSREKIKIGTDKKIEPVLDIVCECYKAAVSRANLTEDDIFAVGMAVPSAVNTEKQILLNAPNLGWKNIKMGVWESQGYADYDGVAWYTIKFTMPEKIDSNAVEIAFDAVDEAAWVWLNGVYLGSHDIGPDGWRESFAMDCTNEIRWGKENILTIRVNDTAYAGGIYKPVRVDILK